MSGPVTCPVCARRVGQFPVGRVAPHREAGNIRRWCAGGRAKVRDAKRDAADIPQTHPRNQAY